MSPVTLRKTAYGMAGFLAVAYVVYVLVLKFSDKMMMGPLGEVGEFCLVLASVTFFSIGLFADEVVRQDDPH